jgi:putative heme iron utilization protein
MDGQDCPPAAWEVRKLLRASRQATLATNDAAQPFASLDTPAVAADGAVLMLLSARSEHTKHVRADGRCALLFAGRADTANPQTAPRVTITGRAAPCRDAGLKAIRVAAEPVARFEANFAPCADAAGESVREVILHAA